MLLILFLKMIWNSHKTFIEVDYALARQSIFCKAKFYSQIKYK